MTRSGIYAIRNTVSGRVYVGSAANIAGRWKTHLHRLRHDWHHSITLQRSWNKHGASAFEWVVLEAVHDLDSLIEREQHWIDRLSSANPRCGFNIARKAGSCRGVKHGPEVTAKRLATLAARTPEEKAATSERLSAARRGRKHGAATLAKMRGQKRSDLTKRRIGAAHRGRAKSLEQRAKIAATLRGRKLGPQSQETIAMRVAATRATKEARREASVQ